MTAQPLTAGAKAPGPGSATVPADHAPLLETAFSLPPVEESYRIHEVEGELPAFLRGTYYLAGPAVFERGGRRYEHWLDGDGLVTALAFEGGAPRFTSRLVRTRKLVAEEAAGRPLYRCFGTAFEGDRLKLGVGLESPANISVYPAGEALLAFGEQGLPWRLDPATLETLGEHDFGRRLNPLSPFSAHPKRDPESGELYNFGISFSPRRPRLHLYRFSPAGELLDRWRLALERPLSVHDFALSRRFAVFHLGPYVLDTRGLVEDGRPLLDCLAWQAGEQSVLLVVDRQSGEPVARVPCGAGYCLHLIEAFESEDGERLTVDLLELDRPVYDQYRLPELFSEVSAAQPVRLVVDPAAASLVERTPFPGWRGMCDFPAVDPRLAGRPYREFWMLGVAASELAGRKFFDRLIHADWRTGRATAWAAPESCYLGGEPVFLPDPAGDAGAVICQQFDAARRVAAGPLAVLPLRRPERLGFHACWVGQPSRRSARSSSM